MKKVLRLAFLAFLYGQQVFAAQKSQFPTRDLFNAVISNKSVDVQKALGDKPNVDAIGSKKDFPSLKNFSLDSFTALMYASQKGYTDIVGILLKGGASINLGAGDWKPVTLSVWNNHPKTLQILLEHNPNITDEFLTREGLTSLMKAAKEGYTDIAQLLLIAGVSVDKKNKDGKTAKDLAQSGNFHYIVELIDQYDTVKQYEPGYYSYEADKVKKIFTIIESGGTRLPVKITGMSQKSNVFEERDLQSLLASLQSNPREKIRDEKGFTFLMAACKANNTKAIQILFNEYKSADVNLGNSEWKPVTIATWYNHVDVLKLLATKKPTMDYDKLAYFGTTPLMHALKKGYKEIANLLISMGAKTKTPEEIYFGAKHQEPGNTVTGTKAISDETAHYKYISKGKTVSYTDEDIKDQKPVQFNSRELDIKIMFDSIEKDQLKLPDDSTIFKTFLNSTKNEFTPLMVAAQKGKLNALSRIFYYGNSFMGGGIDLDVGNKDWKPVSLAVWNNHADVLRMFAGKQPENPPRKFTLYDVSKLNPNIDDEYLLHDDITPLMKAAQEGYTNVAKVLLEMGVNTLWKDKDGKTAGQVAFENGYTGIVDLIAQYKPTTVYSQATLDLFKAVTNNDIKAAKDALNRDAHYDVLREKDKMTPLMIACQKGHIEIIKLLLSYNADVNKGTQEATPILLAVINNKKDVLEVLASHKPKLNFIVTSHSKKNLLMMAALYNYVDIAKVLLDMEMTMSGQDSMGEDVEEIVGKYNKNPGKFLELLKTFKKKRSSRALANRSLKTAATSGDVEGVKKALQDGALIIPEDGAVTPLAMAKNFDVIKILFPLALKGQQRVYWTDYDIKGAITAFNTLTNLQKNEIVNLSIDNTVSPLYYAAQHKDAIDLSKALINAGAKLGTIVYVKDDTEMLKAVGLAPNDQIKKFAQTHDASVFKKSVKTYVKRNSELAKYIQIYLGSVGKKIIEAIQHSKLEDAKLFVEQVIGTPDAPKVLSSTYTDEQHFENSLLTLAVRHNATDLVQALVTGGADAAYPVHAEGTKGIVYPLNLAIVIGNSQMVKALKDAMKLEPQHISALKQEVNYLLSAPDNAKMYMTQLGVMQDSAGPKGEYQKIADMFN